MGRGRGQRLRQDGRSRRTLSRGRGRGRGIPPSNGQEGLIKCKLLPPHDDPANTSANTNKKGWLFELLSSCLTAMFLLDTSLNGAQCKELKRELTGGKGRGGGILGRSSHVEKSVGHGDSSEKG